MTPPCVHQCTGCADNDHRGMSAVTYAPIAGQRFSSRLCPKSHGRCTARAQYVSPGAAVVEFDFLSLSALLSPSACLHR
jgi:hypothetical protein